MREIIDKMSYFIGPQKMKMSLGRHLEASLSNIKIHLLRLHFSCSIVLHKNVNSKFGKLVPCHVCMFRPTDPSNWKLCVDFQVFLSLAMDKKLNRN